MKQKRKYRRLSDQDALELVLAYHRGEANQPELAAKFSVDSGYVCRLVHGDTRPRIYEAAKHVLETVA